MSPARLTLAPRTWLALLAPLAVACADGATGAGEAPLADAGGDVLAWVGEPADFDGAGSIGAADFAWDFGDGGDGQGESVAHTYDAPGHYSAYLTVTDADGRTDSDEIRVTAVRRPLDEPPRASSALAADDRRVYAVMPDFDRVAVLDRATMTLSGHLETCAGPRSLSVYGGLLAVACPEDDAVALFVAAEGADDLDAAGEIALGWGDRPFGVAIGDGVVYAALQGTGEVAALDPDALSEAERWAVGADLRGLAWVDGEVLASRHRSPSDGGRWWRLDPSTGAIVEGVLPLSSGPDSDTDARGLPNYLQRIAVRPDGRAAALGGLKSNIERGEHREGQPLTPDSTVRATLRHVGLGADLGAEVEEPLYDNRDLITAVTFSALGDYVYTASIGAEVIDVLDAVTMLRAGGFQDAGGGLEGLVELDGALWALASHDREIRVFDVTELGGAQVERARIDLRGALAEPLSEAELLGRDVFYRAGDPRMSRDSYISCASCHLDGDQDNQTWDFTDRGEGLRNTIGLVGRGGDAQGPIHWSGNFDEIQDFENDVRGAFGGAGFLSEADWAESSDTLGPSKAGRSEELDALAVYVASLEDAAPRSPHRGFDGEPSEQSLIGEALFNSAALGCADCHPPPLYTDSSWGEDGAPLLHDVGTLTDASGGRLGEALTGLDTPTLRGLHESAPYLHDGSAATLREALIDRNPDDRHGATSALSDDEVDALESFLLSLE